jgi:hypothetical protein
LASNQFDRAGFSLLYRIFLFPRLTFAFSLSQFSSSASPNLIPDLITAMRRIDAILICVGFFGAGGLIYVGFKSFGLGDLDAGIWSQVLLVIGLLGWVATYLVRAVTHNMSYDQQRQNHEDTVLRNRLAGMTKAEIAQLETEVATAKAAQIQNTQIPNPQTQNN